MNPNLVILGGFLFETRRRPIPSCCQHDERAITQTAGVPCSVVDIGIPAARSRNHSALVSCCATLLGSGPKRLRLCFELRQYTALLGGETGRRRAPLSANCESNDAKSRHCRQSHADQVSRAARHTI